jgi:hypothetical protein
MTNPVSGDALTALVAKWRKEAAASIEGGQFESGEAFAKEMLAHELAALIAAGRSAATTDLLDLKIVDDRTTRTECCGALVADDNRFCPACGWEFRAAPAPLPAPTADPTLEQS